jgi:methylenetetrahydrofolate dehydrogenase (NADP+)/methenyltetrahydrofolate cyclohydrolase
VIKFVVLEITRKNKLNNNTLILDGNKVSQWYYQQLAETVTSISRQLGFKPKLATVQVGLDKNSKRYTRMKRDAARSIGLATKKIEICDTSSTEALIKIIQGLNNNHKVCGILLQHPLPPHINGRKCFDSIHTLKDVDGVSSLSFAKRSLGLKAHGCASAQGIKHLLNFYDIAYEGKHAVVVGRSPILGKPLSTMLLNRDCTVTVCHSKTKNLENIVSKADILIAACGQPKLIKAEWLKQGVILVDSGYHNGGIGDTDLENCIPKCSAYTPIPGGVGPMTICTLISQTVDAACQLYLS